MKIFLLTILLSGQLAVSDTTFIKDKGIFLYRSGSKCDTVKLIDRMKQIKGIKDDKQRVIEYEKLNNLLK